MKFHIFVVFKWHRGSERVNTCWWGAWWSQPQSLFNLFILLSSHSFLSDLASFSKLSSFLLLYYLPCILPAHFVPACLCRFISLPLFIQNYLSSKHILFSGPPPWIVHDDQYTPLHPSWALLGGPSFSHSASLVVRISNKYCPGKATVWTRLSQLLLLRLGDRAFLCRVRSR